MIVGVTGPTGAGKSFFCSMLAERGFCVLDCDDIYHDIISGPSDCTSELCLRFGKEILDKNNGIDRAALASIVFNDENALSDLNSITHRYVLLRVSELAKQAAKNGIDSVVDAPLLFESGFDKKCDITVAILSSRSKRTERLMSRDGKFRTREQLESRISAAKPDEYYISRCDKVFYNNNDGSTKEMSDFADKIAEAAKKF